MATVSKAIRWGLMRADCAIILAMDTVCACGRMPDESTMASHDSVLVAHQSSNVETLGVSVGEECPQCGSTGQHDHTADASRAELAEYSRRHYEGVSSQAQSWLSNIPSAIDAWEREPELEATITKLRAELHQATQAGTPYWHERDAANSLILENSRLRELLAKAGIDVEPE